jgi:hypothetical protein
MTTRSSLGPGLHAMSILRLIQTIAIRTLVIHSPECSEHKGRVEADGALQPRDAVCFVASVGRPASPRGPMAHISAARLAVLELHPRTLACLGAADRKQPPR